MKTLSQDLITRFRQLPMRYPWLRWAALALGLGFSVGVTYYFHVQVQQEAYSRVQAEAIGMADAVESRIRAYSDVLFALRGFFNASDNVTRDDFHQFAEALSLNERYPGVTNISLAVRVPHARKLEYERAVRAETSPLVKDLPPFAIKPPGERAEYAVLSFIEPMGKNLPAWGLDLNADPIRRAAMDHARDSGQLASTTGVTLLRDSNSSISSTLLRLALYRGGSVPQSVEERRRLYWGMAGSTVRISEMIAATLPKDTLSRVHVQVHDMGTGSVIEAGEGTLLYDSAAPEGGAPAQTPHEFSEYRADHLVSVADHAWRVRVTPREDPVDVLDKIGTGATLIALLAATVLLFWLVSSIATSESRAVELARSNVALKALSESNQIAAAVIRNSEEGVMVVAADLTIRAVNPAFEKITGFAASAAIGKTPRILFSGRHDDAFFEQMHRELDLHGTWRGEIWNRRRSGEHYPQQTSLSALRASDGSIAHYAAVFHDRTAEYEAEAKLRELSSVDGLTGIANRRIFDETLATEWARALREARPLSLLMADIDHFKAYNDFNGHLAGDGCLKEVAATIAATVRRAGDLAARYGGEEFAVILPASDAAAAAAMAEKIRASVAALEVPHGGSPVAPVVTLSIGAATLVPARASQAAGLIAAADAALYAAKHAGRNRVVCRTGEIPAARAA